MMRVKGYFAAMLIILGGCAANGETAGTIVPPASPPETVTAAKADTSGTDGYVPRSDMLSCEYFDSESFVLWDGRAEEYPSDRPIYCGTAPHHLTAGHMIAGFFKAAAKSRSDVETVVVVATAHYEGEKLRTSYRSWDTPFGVLETNSDITDAFCTLLGAAPDDAGVEKDHSASSHIPFIKHYFPEAKTACLLVAPNNDRTVPERIARVLSELPGADKCLFLFSIDFSHYLSSAEADICDAGTREAVEARDYGSIERFGNDNVDSPVCLSAYVRLSDLLGKSIIEADNSNTPKVNRSPYSEEAYSDGVTSYFVFLTV